jgi:small nuclear ribonucleoprotein (snRNP)-like protein
MELEQYVGKKVRVQTTGNNEYIGKAVGYVQAIDNEPEIAEISIENEIDNKNYSLFETEILKIEIVE